MTFIAKTARKRRFSIYARVHTCSTRSSSGTVCVNVSSCLRWGQDDAYEQSHVVELEAKASSESTLISTINTWVYFDCFLRVMMTLALAWCAKYVLNEPNKARLMAPCPLDPTTTVSTVTKKRKENSHLLCTFTNTIQM